MTTDYQTLIAQARALTADESDVIANMANISALLFNGMQGLNWAGFYRVVDGELVLGPFQGQTACIRIAFGKGVCGTAAATKVTQIVADVHLFEGHIACDSASNSEIVIPLIVNDEVVAVLDIDSPEFDRFSAIDAENLSEIVNILVANWS
ncbi:GAF domain-containing protein [Alteromonas sp. ASW11-36]|uniref:GAF domain-containing protein n=1 Tax=Alteromonas arenosi TaxID=3055817 RepID=A0ABT7SXH3_9ALTE|nr:GAF domain-containing protein [Alteromonas sp. ASW11-36]MDM7860886.1 GAF domain-containing protein [Alteromonas sp. ASW11-36]